MQNGNISNRVAPTLLVRINNTLIKKKTKFSLKGLLKRENNYEIDLAAYDFIMRTFLYTDYKIDLYMDYDEVALHKDLFLDMLNTHQIPYGSVKYLDTYQVTTLLNSGVYMCYIDNDIQYSSQIGNSHVYLVEEANNLIKRG